MNQYLSTKCRLIIDSKETANKPLEKKADK